MPERRVGLRIAPRSAEGTDHDLPGIDGVDGNTCLAVVEMVGVLKVWIGVADDRIDDSDDPRCGASELGTAAGPAVSLGIAGRKYGVVSLGELWSD